MLTRQGHGVQAGNSPTAGPRNAPLRSAALQSESPGTPAEPLPPELGRPSRPSASLSPSAMWGLGPVF